ncbi:hypothetical protein K439DRAFT_380622 [Ramaria rubella]|nr:hypothetical protein K439DRAFT_380622 [Ramaria rubella]
MRRCYCGCHEQCARPQWHHPCENFTVFSFSLLLYPLLQFGIDAQDCLCAGRGWHWWCEQECAGVLVVWLANGRRWGSAGVDRGCGWWSGTPWGCRWSR